MSRQRELLLTSDVVLKDPGRGNARWFHEFPTISHYCTFLRICVGDDDVLIPRTTPPSEDLNHAATPPSLLPHADEMEKVNDVNIEKQETGRLFVRKRFHKIKYRTGFPPFVFAKSCTGRCRCRQMLPTPIQNQHQHQHLTPERNRGRMIIILRGRGMWGGDRPWKEIR